jgi:hypothetical protein
VICSPPQSGFTLLNMRLPQSSISAPSLPIAFIAGALALTSLLSPCAFAATQQLSASPAFIGFAAVAVGQKQTELVVLTNNGHTDVTISAVSVSNVEFSVSGMSLPTTVAPGAQTTFSVTFSPTEIGWVNGVMVVTSNASNGVLGLPLHGGGETVQPLQAKPASVSFGNVRVGGTSTIPVVLTNTSSSGVTLTGVSDFVKGFSASGIAFPTRLKPGASVTLNVTFAPTFAGMSAGRVAVVDSAPLNIPLQGTGTTLGQLSVSPTSLNFGNVAVGTTSTDTLTMSALGGNVTVSSASSSNAQFTIAGVSFPLTLNSGQSLPLKLVFMPQAAATSPATVTFNSNATNSSVRESVSGTGTAPYVTLSWSPSASQVSGYNVYRGTTPGTYSRINSALASSTTYTDRSVASGATYYYAATAVDSSGKESTYSSAVQVRIP